MNDAESASRMFVAELFRILFVVAAIALLIDGIAVPRSRAHR
jgi:hypothetical protein